MPVLSQGNIFDTLERGEARLALIFGHIGLNYMNLAWKDFSRRSLIFRNCRNPFDELSDHAISLADDRWVWFVAEEQNHGISDERLHLILDEVVAWARGCGLRRIVTNGVRDIDHAIGSEANRRSNDRRVRLLVDYASAEEKKGGLKFELINLNDSFVRVESFS